MISKTDDNNIVICQLSNYAPSFRGNFLYSLFDLEKKINEHCNTNKMIYVFFKDTSKCQWAKEMEENKSIYYLSNKNLKGFLELRKILKINHVNILHLHFTAPIIFLILLNIFCPYIKIILHYHNIFSEFHYNVILNSLKRKVKIFLYNHFLHMICGCSETVYLDFINSGMNKLKCCYIDNCIVFSRLDVNCENGKEIYKIQNKKVLMIYGSNFYKKGVDIAINAIHNIAEQYNIIFMIVTQNKDSVLQGIKKICNSVPEWVILTPPQENIAYYFKMSDIYLAPSKEEGFAYANLESIYCGTPVIRSDLPAMDRKMPNDMSFPVNNFSVLQERIISVLNQTRDVKESILKEQKEYIMHGWNIDVWSKHILNMYLEILNNPKKTGL
jgi:glycosyltransferase involved in cell wall biosynthesis